MMTTKQKSRSSRTTTAKSRAQREAQAKQLHELLASQSAALADSTQWRAYLDFVGAFHSYSAANAMLIFAQHPDATRVAGYRKWLELGRQVRAGEKAIKIRGFSKKNLTVEDPETGEETETARVRFPILSVFDISQTDPIPGAPQPEEAAQILEGDDPVGIFDRAAAWIGTQGWTIEGEPLAMAYGYTDPTTRRIVVRDEIPAAQAAKTLLHEIAHALMHADDAPGTYVAHRGRCEVEAESVAYVTAGLLGLDTEAYSVGYVTGWANGDPALISETAQRVLLTVHQIADALNVDEPSHVAA